MKRKPSEKTKTVHITLKLPPLLWDEFQVILEQERRSAPEMVYHLINQTVNVWNESRRGKFWRNQVAVRDKAKLDTLASVKTWLRQQGGTAAGDKASDRQA